MGYAYNELIAPAVLYRNPGITREEFVEILDGTHTSWHYEYAPEQAWDYYNPGFEKDIYHEGLSGLARILRLDETERFCEYQESRVDENGLLVRAPYVVPVSFLGADHKFEVIVHERNVIGKPKVIKNEYSFEKLRQGDVWKEHFMGEECGLVASIIREQFIGQENPGDSRDFPGEQDPQYQYDLIINPIKSVWKKYKYKSEARLYRSWPTFHPDNVFDWNAVSGSFYGGFYFDINNFRWRKKDGKYFLEESTFDRIPASVNSGDGMELGYTDLILTAEAIKHNAWKLLSYRGGIHIQDFLRDFPDSREEYERAVWDSHVSLSAKSQGVNISDLLRLRMLGEGHTYR
ncbi:MAG: hypothetical protein Q8P81_01045 [Nanoarchaeota archaeon]|nr:hypothetical protein [Nanoarchaeota archaeon]